MLTGMGGNDRLVATNDNLRDTLDGGTGVDTADYSAYSAGLTVNLGAAAPVTVGGSGTGTTTDVLISIENFTGGVGNDSITGSAGANVLNGGNGTDTLSGGAGADSLNGGAGADLLIGGDGADTIDTGAANGTDQDLIRFSAVSEYGDVVFNFDANGTDAEDDQVELAGALNTAFDDGLNDDNFLFVVGNGGAGSVNATFGQADANFEAALLLGAAGEGVVTASLNSAAAVSAAFNAEFNITAANGEDVMLVINDTNANSFSVWQWIQAGGGEISAAELTLLGVFAANAMVTAGNFDFA